MKKGIICILSVLVCISCSVKQQYSVSSMSGERILVTETKHPDAKMQSMVQKYKSRLDKEMNIVIGKSEQDMPFGKPESLLTNLTSDVMLQLDSQYTNKLSLDIAVMNVNGHRAPMPKGDITVGDIYEVYSFDNELAIAQLMGNDVIKLFEEFAAMGGTGVSSNIKLTISKDGKLINATIGGKPVDKNKTYTIITLDYLADGNDGMDAFKKSVSIYKPGIILRDYMLDYVKKQTSEGKNISSKLDGRITVK